MSEPSIRRYQESVTVVAPAEALYDMVSDITRTGEWSPVCTSCWWDEEAQAGQVGAWFNGHNELPDRTWETRSEVVVAERGREFAWVVGGSFVRWGFTLVPAGLGAWVGNNFHDHLWRKKLRIRLPGSGCPNFWDFGPSWWSASSDSPVGLALRTHAPRWLVFYGCFVGRGDGIGAGERVTQAAVTREFVGTYWVSRLLCVSGWGPQGRGGGSVGPGVTPPGQMRASTHLGPDARVSPSTPNRARLTAAASKEKSAATLVCPRTRARLPPCRRRIRCPSLRSTFGLVAWYSARQAGSFWVARARVSSPSWGPILMVRPVLAVVHWAASGQLAQAPPKAAVPPPALAGWIGTVTWAGQVAVPAPRSMVKASLGNRPPGATGGCTLVMMSAPAASSFSSSTPAP